MPSSRGSSQSRDRTQVSRIASGFFPIWATKEVQYDKVFSLLWTLEWRSRLAHRVDCLSLAEDLACNYLMKRWLSSTSECLDQMNQTNEHWFRALDVWESSTWSTLMYIQNWLRLPEACSLASTLPWTEITMPQADVRYRVKCKEGISLPELTGRDLKVRSISWALLGSGGVLEDGGGHRRKGKFTHSCSAYF